MFLPHKITVLRATKTLVRGTYVSSFSAIYSDIPAMVFKKTGDLSDTDLWVNTSNESYEVIIENRNIQIGDQVVIELTPLFIQENYVVEDVDYNYSKISWWVDNVYFTIKRQYD